MTTTFGATLKGVLAAHRLSQNKAAEMADYDHSYLSRLIAGTRMPTREFIDCLANNCGFTDDECGACSSPPASSPTISAPRRWIPSSRTPRRRSTTPRSPRCTGSPCGSRLAPWWGLRGRWRRRKNRMNTWVSAKMNGTAQVLVTPAPPLTTRSGISRGGLMPHSTCSIPLPCGCQTLIDEDDWPRVQGLTLYRNANGYVYFSVWESGRHISQSLHVFLMQTPSGMVTDHINGDPLDNRRSVNLRVATPQVNQVNRHRLNRNNKTGIRGVNYYPHVSETHPWKAQIKVNYRNYHLGMFASRDEAIAARKAAEIEHYGEECP